MSLRFLLKPACGAVSFKEATSNTRFPPVNEKQNQFFHLGPRRTLAAIIFGVGLSTTPIGLTGQKDHQHSSMPGMDMHEDMGDMGPSMAAMAGHMYMTPLRPKQPGDLEKTKAVVAQAKSAIERYKDYRKALLDGYYIANPKVKQAQYHFISNVNTREADLHFDAS